MVMVADSWLLWVKVVQKVAAWVGIKVREVGIKVKVAGVKVVAKVAVGGGWTAAWAPPGGLPPSNLKVEGAPLGMRQRMF